VNRCLLFLLRRGVMGNPHECVDTWLGSGRLDGHNPCEFCMAVMRDLSHGRAQHGPLRRTKIETKPTDHE
jgi:hypothetical protein